MFSSDISIHAKVPQPNTEKLCSLHLMLSLQALTGIQHYSITAIDKLVDNGSLLNLSADVGTDPSGCLLHCIPVMKKREVKVWN